VQLGVVVPDAVRSPLPHAGVHDRALAHPSAQNHETTWLGRAAPGLALLGLSIAVTLADQAYAGEAGEVFSVGPLRALWIAVLFMLSGIGWLAYQFLTRDR
jgi:hypothetical protein